jgi:hypothetical protein
VCEGKKKKKNNFGISLAFFIFKRGQIGKAEMWKSPKRKTKLYFNYHIIKKNPEEMKCEQSHPSKSSVLHQRRKTQEKKYAIGGKLGPDLQENGRKGKSVQCAAWGFFFQERKK